MTTDTTEIIEAEPAPPAWETNRVPGAWAIVEIMGRKVRAGSVSDAQLGGATMLCVQHPDAPDADKTGPLTEYYAPGALFSIRPCSRETASQWANARWRAAVPEIALAELTAVEPGALDDDYDDTYIDQGDFDG